MDHVAERVERPTRLGHWQGVHGFAPSEANRRHPDDAPPGLRNLHGLPRRVAQVQVDGVTMTGDSNMDLVLDAVVARHAAERRHRVLDRLTAGRSAGLAVVLTCQPGADDFAPEPMMFEVTRDWDA